MTNKNVSVDLNFTTDNAKQSATELGDFVEQKLTEAGRRGGDGLGRALNSAELRKYREELDRITQKFAELKRQADSDLKGLPDPADTQQVKQLREELERAERQLRQFREEADRLDRSKRAFTGTKEEVEKLKREVRESRNEIDKLGDEAERTARKTDRLGDSGKTTGGKLGGVASSLGNVAQIAAGIGLAALADGFLQLAGRVVEFGNASLEAFGTFERGIAEVTTLLPQLNEQGIGKLTDDLLEFNTEAKRLSAETIPATYQALSAGIPEENVFDFLTEASSSARAGVADLEVSVDTLTSILNAYQIPAERTRDVSDQIFATIRLGKTTFSELGGSIAQVTPIAAANNIELSNILGAIATLTANGAPTAQSITQIRSAISELIDPTSAAAEYFEELSGQSVKQFIEQGGDLQQVLSIIVGGANDAGIEVSTLFGRIEALNAALVLGGSGSERYADNLRQIEDSAGATQQAAERFAGSLDEAEAAADAASEALQLAVGEALSPYKREWLEVKAAVAEGVTEIINARQAIKDTDAQIVSSRDLLEGLIADEYELSAAILTVNSAFNQFDSESMDQNLDATRILIALLEEGIYDTTEAAAQVAVDLVQAGESYESYSIGVEAARIETLLFRAAIDGTPEQIALLARGLADGTYEFSQLTAEIQDAINATDEADSSTQQYESSLGFSHAAVRRQRDAQEDANEEWLRSLGILPALSGAVDNDTAAIDDNTDAVYANLDARAKLGISNPIRQELQSRGLVTREDYRDLEQLLKSQDDAAEIAERLADQNERVTGSYGGVSRASREATEEARQLESAQRTLIDAQRKLEDLQTRRERKREDIDLKLRQDTAKAEAKASAEITAMTDKRRDLEAEIADIRNGNAEDIAEVEAEISAERTRAENEIDTIRTTAANEIAVIENEIIAKRKQAAIDFENARAEAFANTLRRVQEEGFNFDEAVEQLRQGLLEAEIAAGDYTLEQAQELAERTGASVEQVTQAIMLAQIEAAREAIASADLDPEQSTQALNDAIAAAIAGENVDEALAEYGVKLRDAQDAELEAVADLETQKQAIKDQALADEEAAKQASQDVIRQIETDAVNERLAEIEQLNIDITARETALQTELQTLRDNATQAQKDADLELQRSTEDLAKSIIRSFEDSFGAASSFQSKVSEIASQLGELPDVVPITIKLIQEGTIPDIGGGGGTSSTPSTGANAPANAMARGGRVYGGRMYRVAEERDEVFVSDGGQLSLLRHQSGRDGLFIPPIDGTILPNVPQSADDFNRAMAQYAGQSIVPLPPSIGGDFGGSGDADGAATEPAPSGAGGDSPSSSSSTAQRPQLTDIQRDYLANLRRGGVDSEFLAGAEAMFLDGRTLGSGAVGRAALATQPITDGMLNAINHLTLLQSELENLNPSMEGYEERVITITDEMREWGNVIDAGAMGITAVGRALANGQLNQEEALALLEQYSASAEEAQRILERLTETENELETAVAELIERKQEENSLVRDAANLLENEVFTRDELIDILEIELGDRTLAIQLLDDELAAREGLGGVLDEALNRRRDEIDAARLLHAEIENGTLTREEAVAMLVEQGLTSEAAIRLLDAEAAAQEGVKNSIAETLAEREEERRLAEEAARWVMDGSLTREQAQNLLASEVGLEKAIELLDQAIGKYDTFGNTLADVAEKRQRLGDALSTGFQDGLGGNTDNPFTDVLNSSDLSIFEQASAGIAGGFINTQQAEAAIKRGLSQARRDELRAMLESGAITPIEWARLSAEFAATLDSVQVQFDEFGSVSNIEELLGLLDNGALFYGGIEPPVEPPIAGTVPIPPGDIPMPPSTSLPEEDWIGRMPPIVMPPPIDPTGFGGSGNPDTKEMARLLRRAVELLEKQSINVTIDGAEARRLARRLEENARRKGANLGVKYD